MTRSIFITGTDTDAGKTFVAAALLKRAYALGLTTAGYKPVAAGCDTTAEGLRNSDALVLQSESHPSLSYLEVNPIAFEAPIAPHIAAALEGRSISLAEISQGYQHLYTQHPDFLVVEGAGGWRLPLGDQRFMSDFVIQHKIPVLLVVGLKLGCLNHAILTREAVLKDGLEVVGWIGNHIDPDMLYGQENIASLRDMFPEPCLGIIPHLKGHQDASDFLADADAYLTT
ncbi:dethiobiotin synthase [Aliiglaciecola sp. LCG003]|uniref:dethiobiotin synthase n=1 Tax=Aliiglaciecola sp. LCG003 TaxID=3053655 RepID=UPI002572912E|nr:dethiobiotin synthase [Aliiglaciecola sp. LCG003]WJG08054.1 dethiobiotin synthase [Aliiglaciecola sp. LCG003]